VQLEPLVQRAKDDQKAFGQLYDLLQPRIYRYVARRIPNISDAEDVTAQVFEKALSGIRGFDPERASFLTWLYRIAHNATVDFYRKEGNRCLVNIDDAMEIYECDPNADERFIRKYLTVLGLLKELPSSYQEVLGLRLIEHMKNEEIAQLLGYSSRYVAVKISRALRSLRQLAVKRGILDELT